MSLTDPVSRFCDAHPQFQSRAPAKLDVPASKLKTEIARILKEEGATSPTTRRPRKMAARCCAVLAEIRRQQPEAAIRDLARISRPGCRVYVGRNEIKRVQNGIGISIMTTPRGVMAGQQARREERGRRGSLRSLVEAKGVSSAVSRTLRLRWNGIRRNPGLAAIRIWKKSMSRIGKKPIPLPKA